MKRKRHLNRQDGKSREMIEIGEGDTVIWSRFGTDLPADIFTDVALRLPVKSILACKCVCKTWRQRILEPEFAELHSKIAQQSIILRITGRNHVSRTLYLLEPQNYSFDDACHDEICSKEQIGMNLDTKLKIPLRDHNLTLGGRLKALAKANFKVRVKGKLLIATKPLEDKYCVVNSCNGLLCLSEPEGNDPVAVCNPVTGEYMKLMGSIKSRFPVGVRINLQGRGLGFCPSTYQYKVVRIYSKHACVPGRLQLKYGRMVVEVHTLGSGSWRDVTMSKVQTLGRMGQLKYYNGLKDPTYVSGKVYWLPAEGEDPDEILLFNMENEQFGSVALPSCHPKRKKTTTMGILHNQICICQSYHFNQLRIWLMNNNNDATSSWEMVFSVDGRMHIWLYYGLYYPMKLYENGALLIFHTSSGLIYVDPKEVGFNYFRIRGGKSKFEVTAYVPSFISLEKQIIGDVKAVQNIIQKCAQVKLREEKSEVFMVSHDVFGVGLEQISEDELG